MTDLMTALPPLFQGPSSDDREAWHEQRRTGITATEVRDLAKGGFADRRRILTEKLTGERADLTGNKYIEHGNRREPIIARWIGSQFDIPENTHVWTRGRYLATPDGYSDDGLIYEIKTSKHDLTPGPIAAGILAMDRVGKTARARHFWSTGYYDQMQWQMLVMGASECLFVWEQHDDQWPDPSPLSPTPAFCWVLRDDERIAALVEIAEAFLTELDAARYAGLPPIGDIPAEVADHAGRLLAARNAEAVAKAQKEQEWRWLQTRLLADGEPDLSLANDQAKITVTTKTEQEDTFLVDEAAFLADPRLPALSDAVAEAQAAAAAAESRAAEAEAALNDLRADFTTKASVTRSSRRLTVTAVKTSTSH